MSHKGSEAVSIYDYVNYRRFLSDRFLELKRKNRLFSYRVFNRIAGLRSPAFLKMVIEGERNLGDDGLRMIARGFRLSDPERTYFENLVRFNQANSLEEKDRYFRELSQTKRFVAAKPLRTAQYRLFARWYYVAILEMVRLEAAEKKDARWLQRQINPPVRLVEIKRAVADLKQMGLIGEKEGGNLFRKEKMITTEEEVRSLAVAQFHLQMGKLAIRAAMREKARDREFSALTIVTAEKSFQDVKRRLRMIRESLHSALEQEEAGPRTVVAQVNMQLFKLNQPGGLS